MTWVEDARAKFDQKWAKMLKEEAKKRLEQSKSRKEVHTMNVSYNGFTGELVKLERISKEQGYILNEVPAKPYIVYIYDISIFDREKSVTHSFTGVKLEDVKFLGGEVSFG